MCLKCRLFSNEVRMCTCECTYFFWLKKNRAGCEPCSTDYVLPTISLCLFFHLALVFVDFVVAKNFFLFPPLTHQPSEESRRLNSTEVLLSALQTGLAFLSVRLTLYYNILLIKTSEHLKFL